MAAAALVATPSLLAAAPAGAASKPITGKLDKAGYTVTALGYNGKASSSEKKSFKLKPLDAKVTLQLRDKHGKYAGPVVVGQKRKGKLAVLGVKAGAELGKIHVDAKAGDAEPVALPPARVIDAKRTAKARKGVPLGARNFGFVRTHRGAVKAMSADRVRYAAASGGADSDSDGVPNTLDVDSDGSHVLDNIEGSTSQDGQDVRVLDRLRVPMPDSVNANAGVTDAAIDEALAANLGVIFFQTSAGDQTELDCGGLTYCSAGGSGEAQLGPPTGGPIPRGPFPACCDSDSDGFGAVINSFGDAAEEKGLLLSPHATASQIQTGDNFIERTPTEGGETDATGTLNYVFATTPVATSWSDGTNSGTFSYPAAAGSAGTVTNPITLTPGSGGEVFLTWTFWRPQRKPIPASGEGTDFIDIGHLNYSTSADAAPAPLGGGFAPGGGDCPSSTYSTSDPNLSPDPDNPTAPHLTDAAADRPASPDNQLSYSVDLTSCFASKGFTWDPGEQVGLSLKAEDKAPSPDQTDQVIWFKVS